MNDEPRIDVRHLVKAYDATLAVDALDLQVPAGQITGLVGPNGAGKTSSMRCMAGIIPPTSGTILIDGHDMKRSPLSAKKALAFVPDTPHLFDYLSVEEHLLFVARLYDVEDPTTKLRALLEEFELEEKTRVLPDALSRGMKQKLAICMAFIHDPAAIILDEPLIGLDPVGIRRMKDAIIHRAREANASVLISSHQLSLVEEICDDILILKDGKRVIQGTLESIRATLGDLEDSASLEDVFFRATAKDEPKPEAEMP